MPNVKNCHIFLTVFKLINLEYLAFLLYEIKKQSLKMRQLFNIKEANLFSFVGVLLLFFSLDNPFTIGRISF